MKNGDFSDFAVFIAVAEEGELYASSCKTWAVTVCTELHSTHA